MEPVLELWPVQHVCQSREMLLVECRSPASTVRMESSKVAATWDASYRLGEETARDEH